MSGLRPSASLIGSLLMLAGLAAAAATNALPLVVEMERIYNNAPSGTKDNLPLKLAWSNLVFTVDEGVGGPISVGVCRAFVYKAGDTTNDLASVVREREGVVVKAWVTDLDGDGRPEIFIWIESAGSGSYGTLEAFRFDGKDLKPFVLPPLPMRETPAYHGHDFFEIKDGKLVTGFPVYTGAEPDESKNFGGNARFELDVKNKLWLRRDTPKQKP